MDVVQWRRTQRVNVEGTFLTARTWLRQLRECSQTEKNNELRNVGLIIVGSESGSLGERSNADYASGKSAVQFGLVKSLMGDVARVWPGAR
jgi:NAD(P)-dependent dehydrogenase (short-subunit alcohol dehydrogenase family)